MNQDWEKEVFESLTQARSNSAWPKIWPLILTLDSPNCPILLFIQSYLQPDLPIVMRCRFPEPVVGKFSCVLDFQFLSAFSGCCLILNDILPSSLVSCVIFSLSWLQRLHVWSRMCGFTRILCSRKDFRFKIILLIV